jgi:hypothetical protein
VEDLTAPAPLAAIVVAIAVADGQLPVMVAADVLLPATAVAIRRRAVAPRMAVDPPTAVVDRRTVAAVAADMGGNGNIALDFFPASNAA